MDVMIGIDIGTTNIKLTAISKESEIIFTCQRKNMIMNNEDYYDFDGKHIFQSVINMLKEAIDGNNIKILSIGISSLAETVFPIYDDNIENDFKSMAWYDKRTESEKNKFFDNISEEDFFLITGLRPEYLYSIFKMKWYYNNQKNLFEKEVKWLPVNSFLAYRLTGSMKIDYSMASRTGALDINNKTWSNKIFDILPYNNKVFPDLVECGMAIGDIKNEIKKNLGITYDIPVSLSGHDHICGSYAVAGFQKNVLLDSMGTAENIMAIIDPSEVSLEELVDENVSLGVHIIPGKFYIYDAFNYSGGVINTLISLFFNIDTENISNKEFDKFIKEAKECKINKNDNINILIGQNDDKLYNKNLDNLNILNIPLDVKRGEVFMAGINYMCNKSNEIISDLEKITNKDFDVIAIGGSTKNSLLMQEKANKLKKDMFINKISEAVTLGAALLGGVGAGVFSDYLTAVESIDREKKRIKFGS